MRTGLKIKTVVVWEKDEEEGKKGIREWRKDREKQGKSGREKYRCRVESQPLVCKYSL